jgi:hypothetical protein
MAFTTIPTPPPTPARNQDPETFNVRIAAFLAFFASLTEALNSYASEVPGEVDTAIADAVAAYDPDGQYSAVQIDGFLAAKADNSRITVSTAPPSGGVDGDIWFKVD